ncbi:hypothetical protein [Endozoicomonas sp. ALC066]|uniref:hypothetical protein n=1 Tax=Endozoicomonas sp. ALC066 TaxID=3403078 RepID=UPI003BB7AA37
MPHVISGYLDLGDIDSNMKAYAVDLENGNYLGAESQLSMESGYYSLELPSAMKDVLVVVAQDLKPWVSGGSFVAGDLIYTKDLSDLVLKVVTGGTAGGSEPSGFSLGESVTDGAVEYLVINHIRPQSLELKDTVEV